MQLIGDLAVRAQKIVLETYPKRLAHGQRIDGTTSDAMHSQHTEIPYLEKVVEALLHRLPTLNELPIQAPYFFVDPPAPSRALMSTDSAAHALEVAQVAVKRFSAVTEDRWNRDTLAAVLKNLPREENLGKSKVVMAAIRITLTGMKVLTFRLCVLTPLTEHLEWPSCSRYNGHSGSGADSGYLITCTVFA